VVVARDLLACSTLWEGQVSTAQSFAVTTSPDDLNEEERALFDAYAVAAQLAVRCRGLRETNSATGADALGFVMNYLMTEFWDQGFSQSEIRTAFEGALGDMNRYAAGDERRR